MTVAYYYTSLLIRFSISTQFGVNKSIFVMKSYLSNMYLLFYRFGVFFESVGL